MVTRIFERDAIPTGATVAVGTQAEQEQPRRESSARMGGREHAHDLVVRAEAAMTEFTDQPLVNSIGRPVFGIGERGEQDLRRLARLRHRVEAAAARQLLAAQRCGSLSLDAATVVAQEQWTPSEARRLLVAARFAQQVATFGHPQLWAMWGAGVISTGHVAALADGHQGKAACDVWGVIGPLLAHLPAMTVHEVVQAVAAARAVTDPDDAAAREQAAYDRRRLRLTPDRDGIRISGVLPTLEGRHLDALLAATCDTLRAAGDRLTAAQRRADALAHVTATAAAGTPASQCCTDAHGDRADGDHDRRRRGSGGCAVTVTISLSEAARLAAGRRRDPIDLTAARAAADGPGAGGPDVVPPADVDGVATIGDAAARFAVCHAPITPIIVAETGSMIDRLTRSRLQPLAVGRRTRLATAAQRKALALRDRGCVIDGCDVPAGQTQAHHVRDYKFGGATDLDNLASACWNHHRQVDLKRWKLTLRDGRWHATPTPRWTWLSGRR